jgi:hypothetical protein
MSISLKNRKKEIIAYSKVSPEHFEEVNAFKWYKGGTGYVQSKINNKVWLLHRYIMIEILKNKTLTPKNPVDHIDGDPLNNCHDNLRIVTHSENSRNKNKKKGTSSKFIGVSREKDNWRVSIRLPNGTRPYAFYDTEIEAAHQYNLWITQHSIKHANRNDVEIPIDFTKWIPTENIRDLPLGIYEIRDKYKVIISMNGKTIYIGTYLTLEEAIHSKVKADKDKESFFQNKLFSRPILKNENGLCYFLVKDQLVFIDEEIYYDIIKYSWQINVNNYVTGEIDKKRFILSRYVMDYNGINYVDHINNNRLDNRKDNLRIVTPTQNAMNMCSQKNSSSKFIGVHYRKDNNKWRTRIKVNDKDINLGQYDTEIEAAKARDVATLKYFGVNGKMNFQNNRVL